VRVLISSDTVFKFSFMVSFGRFWGKNHGLRFCFDWSERPIPRLEVNKLHHRSLQESILQINKSAKIKNVTKQLTVLTMHLKSFKTMSKQFTAHDPVCHGCSQSQHT